MNILVVGGTSGIGQECAIALAEDNMVVAPDTEQLDVTDNDSIEVFFRQKDPSMFEGLVYSAGINYLEWSHDVDEHKMFHTYDVNVFGFIRLMRYMHPKRCVVVGSDAADMPMRTSVVYNSSKAALHAAVRVIARERAWGQYNVVAPGKIEDTDMTRYVERRTVELREWTPSDLLVYEKSKIPSGRYGQKDEVAKVVKWLMLEAPEYLNGEIIKVNGGR